MQARVKFSLPLRPMREIANQPRGDAMMLLNRKILFVAVIGAACLTISPVISYAQNDPCFTINQGTPRAACQHPLARCDAGTGPGTGRCVYEGPDLRCDCLATGSAVALTSHFNYALAVLPLTPASVQFSNLATFNANSANGSGSTTLEKFARLLAGWTLR